MRTLLPDPPPADFEALLERRRRLDLDRRDEIWEGVYHVIPLPSFAHQRIAEQLAIIGPLARAAGLEPLIRDFGLGEPDDYRVPDGGLHRPGAHGVWHPTAALAIEILSPGEDLRAKLPFYAAHQVDEILILDPRSCVVEWLALSESCYEPIDSSRLVDMGPEKLAKLIEWPSAE